MRLKEAWNSRIVHRSCGYNLPNYVPFIYQVLYTKEYKHLYVIFTLLGNFKEVKLLRLIDLL
jgi:hypothetical protein